MATVKVEYTDLEYVKEKVEEALQAVNDEDGETIAELEKALDILRNALDA